MKVTKFEFISLRKSTNHSTVAETRKRVNTKLIKIGTANCDLRNIFQKFKALFLLADVVFECKKLLGCR